MADGDLEGPRDKAAKFLAKVTAAEVPSSLNGVPGDAGADNPLFTVLTGMSHVSLQATWKTEKVLLESKLAEAKALKGRDLTPDERTFIASQTAHTTSCNGFTGKLGQAIGSTFVLGQFPLAKALPAAGFGDAWIPATSGKRPLLGDVFKMKKFHVGVSEKFVGETWHTVEGGQGGSLRGFDSVKRKETTWDPGKLEGWCDIEILMDLLGARVPAWLQGWWRFEIGSRKEFVFFPGRGKALGSDRPPANVKVRPTEGRSGKLVITDNDQAVSIAWPAGAGTDEMRHLAGVDYMLGRRAGAEVQAYRMK